MISINNSQFLRIHSKERKNLLNAFYTIFLAIPLIIFISVFPNDWAGWVLMYCSFPLLFIFKTKGHFFSAFVILLVHQITAFINAYISTTIGADKDAIVFHIDASNLLYNQIDLVKLFTPGSDFYENYLSVFYKLLGDSLFLGEQLTIIAFILSMKAFLNIMNKINLTKYQSTTLLLYGLLPTTFLLTSITMREAYQMLFFNLSIYFALCLKDKISISTIFKLSLSTVVLGFWHNGLFAFCPILLFVSFYWSSKTRGKRSIGKKILLTGLGILMVFVWVILVKHGVSSGATSNLFSGNTLQYTNQYRDSAVDSRATYNVNLDTSSIIGVIKTFPLVFIYYLFTPFPWQIGSSMDIYAFFESFLRLILIYYSFKLWKKSNKQDKPKYGFMLLMFFALEMLWSFGTTNWGTAMRHHLLAYGIITILGGQGLFNAIKKSLIAIARK